MWQQRNLNEKDGNETVTNANMFLLLTDIPRMCFCFRLTSTFLFIFRRVKVESGIGI